MSIISVKNKEISTLSITFGIVSIIAFGLLSIVSAYWLMGLLISALIVGRSEGIEIDSEQFIYRNYTQFYGKTFGSWQSLSRYSSLVVLSKSGIKESMGMLANSTYEVRGIQFYELYLMDTLHLKRLFVHSSKDKQEIKTLIETLLASTPLKYEKYNPRTLSNRY